MMYDIYKTEEYLYWLSEQTKKSTKQIEDRLNRIKEEGHFGHIKYLDDHGIWELKFNDGRRIYYFLSDDRRILILLGGNKNGQDKDIKKATSILRKA